MQTVSPATSAAPSRQERFGRFTVEQVNSDQDDSKPFVLEFHYPEAGTSQTGCLMTVGGRVRAVDRQDKREYKVRIAACGVTIAKVPLAPPGRRRGREFLAQVSVFGLARRANVVLYAETDDGELTRLGSIQLALEPPEPYDTSLTPLMLNGLPRSGTTWFMSLLSEHPSIIVDGRYPYEMRHCTYWTHMLRVLLQPELARDGDTAKGLVANHLFVPQSPYNPGRTSTRSEWYAHDYAGHLAGLCAKLSDDYYRQVAREQGKSDAIVFAEKWPGRVEPQVMRWLFSRVREVFILRAPRDVCLSILRFNARRGYADFGVEQFGSGEAFVEMLSRQLREQIWLFEARTADGSGVLVNYDRLCENTADTLARLLADLDLEHDRRTLEEIIRKSERHKVSKHITSRGNEKKLDLDPQMDEWINHYFKDIIDRFWPTA